MLDQFARQSVLLTLLEEMRAKGSWCGETHLQKSAYFLQEGLGVPLALEFTLYKHGPFSFDLREVLGEMRGNFLIEVESRYPYGSSLEVSEPGRRLKERFPKTTSKFIDQIEFVAKSLSSRDVVALERIGTALYVRNLQPDSSPDERADKITELKPHIDLELARSAVDEVELLLSRAPRIGQQTNSS